MISPSSGQLRYDGSSSPPVLCTLSGPAVGSEGRVAERALFIAEVASQKHLPTSVRTFFRARESVPTAGGAVWLQNGPRFARLNTDLLVAPSSASRR